jgi:transglutaminase-like putative cysteine protease
VRFAQSDVAERARTYPFAYTADDGENLARFIGQELPGRRVERWARSFLRERGTTDTRALFVGMTQWIRRTFCHGARHQKGARTPLRTLEFASGACRDLAVQTIASLRSLGIAPRFVSGYLNMPDPDDDSPAGATRTHECRHMCRVRAGLMSTPQRHDRQ